MQATHIVNFGFGELAVKKIGSYFHTVKSDDPMMPVGTEFPIKDTEVLEASVAEI